MSNWYLQIVYAVVCTCMHVCVYGSGGGDYGNKNCKHPYHNVLEVLRKSGGWSVSRPTSEQQLTIMCDTDTHLHEGSVPWSFDFTYVETWHTTVHGVDHPPSSSAEVKERVELYLCYPSGPLWPVLWWTVPLPLYICMGVREREREREREMVKPMSLCTCLQ
jgi:hypothetical protein